MRTRNIYFLITLFIGICSTKAQQDPSYILYRYNMNFVNPAYAGAEERTEFGANIRSQWSGVQGAPETQSLMASTYMGKNVGLGVSIVNDKTFIETQTSIAIDFSYKIQWNDYTNMYFGLKASGNSYNANTDGLMTYGIQSDPSLMNINGGITPNVGTGVYFHSRKLSLSLSVPKILKPKRLEQDGGLAKLGRNKIHTYLMAAYDHTINENLILKPSTMLRYVEGSPLSVDATLALNYNESFEFGAAYRLDEGFSGFVVLDLVNSIHIGYAYEASLNSTLIHSNNGTHEIFLKFVL
ncbi:type IX secretion system membrane protein PorP/SprF [Maribacter sp. X9]|uniref:PorP/SprF family type IX secretion system membrane protein n=1 Tax=Maribacter sp. X9 TaxID=3402159 RepID=UPI003AF3CD73